MDSDPPPITAPARHTEATDTRQAIRREDPATREQRRPPPRKPSPRAPTDSTRISIPALRAFLHELLGGADTASAPPSPAEPAALSPYNPYTTASRAYGARAASSLPTPPPPPAAPPPSPPAGLTAGDITAIHHLLSLLDALAQQGVAALEITSPHSNMSLSFLQNLTESAQRTLGIR